MPYIENISEDSLKKIILSQLKELNKNMVEDDFEFFIDYLESVYKVIIFLPKQFWS